MPKFKLKARKITEKEKIIQDADGQSYIVSPRKRTRPRLGRDYVHYGGIIQP